MAYIEHNFGLGFINPGYQFADAHAPDGASLNIPLSDFFSLPTRRTFTRINTSRPLSYFTNNPAGPAGPGDNGNPD